MSQQALVPGVLAHLSENYNPLNLATLSLTPGYMYFIKKQ
jgi:hypothetical protein